MNSCQQGIASLYCSTEKCQAILNFIIGNCLEAGRNMLLQSLNDATAI